MEFSDIFDLVTGAKTRKRLFKCFVLRTYLQFWTSLSSIFAVWTKHSFAVIWKIFILQFLRPLQKMYFKCHIWVQS